MGITAKLPTPEVIEDCEENQSLWDEVTSPAPLDAPDAPKKGWKFAAQLVQLTAKFFPKSLTKQKILL